MCLRMLRPVTCATSLAIMALPVYSFKTFVLPNSASAQKMSRGRASIPALRETRADDTGVGPPSRTSTEVVTEVLRLIDDTDRGAFVEPQKRNVIDSMITELGAEGRDKDWLSDARLFGNYNVAYVSSGSSQEGNPAGGRYRGRVGRALLRTENLFQHLLSPATAVNMVSFRLFGLLPGCVTLRGDFEAIPDRPNFVRASFERPWLNLLGKNGLTFRLGPKSTVTLGTTYVDERVRIGEGGRGSLFVFTRGGPASTPAAEEWMAYTKDRPNSPWLLAATAAYGAAVCIARTAFVPAGILGVTSVLLLSRRPKE